MKFSMPDKYALLGWFIVGFICVLIGMDIVESINTHDHLMYLKSNAPLTRFNMRIISYYSKEPIQVEIKDQKQLDSISVALKEAIK